MRFRNEIEELEAKFEHLQDRFDRLRDHITENPCGEYYWNKFEDLLAWSLKFDKNSEEYEILSKTAWSMLEQYMNIVMTVRVKNEN